MSEREVANNHLPNIVALPIPCIVQQRHYNNGIYPARALRALGLLLYSRNGEDFLTGQLNFFTETAVTPERKVEKSFPRWEINRHGEG